MEFSVNVILFSVFYYCGCAKLGAGNDDLEKKKFLSIQREYGEWRLRLYPEYSTSKGFYQYNDQIQSYDWHQFDIVQNTTSEYLDRLRTVQYDKLSRNIQVDYDILEATLLSLLDGYKWRFFSALNPLSSLEGPQMDLRKHRLESVTKFNTRGDFENYLDRLKAYPNQIKEVQDRMDLAIQYNRTNHNVSMWRVPKDISDLLTDTPESFLLYKPFNETLERIPAISANDKQSIRERARSFIERILTSFRQLRNYTEKVYSNHLRSGIGVSSWDGGKEFYEAVLKWHLSLDMTPSEVHDQGLKEVNRIYQQMIKIIKKLGFSGTVKDFFQSLKNDSRFHTDSRDVIVNKFGNIIHNQIQQKLPLLFKDLPGLPVMVKPTPIDGPFAYYIAGSEDGSRPGVFYINVFRPSDSSFTDFMAVALHESNPGHHLQISIATTNDLPSYRKYRDSNKYFQIPFRFAMNTAYVEGWGLYSEYLGEEMNLYTDEYSLLGRYSSEIFRACRLVVDTGIHYFNWSRERAIHYMMNYTTMGRGNLENEIDRYITMPGQACSYKIGELKILDLRKRAEQSLGSKFDIKDFHSTVLKNGAVPLNILEKIVDRWIADVKQYEVSLSVQCTSDTTRITSCFFTIIHIFVAFLIICLFN